MSQGDGPIRVVDVRAIPVGFDPAREWMSIAPVPLVIGDPRPSGSIGRIGSSEGVERADIDQLAEPPERHHTSLLERAASSVSRRRPHQDGS